ncbi:hypothetical protein QBK99_23815 [Corticibacterium sp. UT-5YL-CI-8]|nr:hypothetical protein [Tianweitania sp. UT-5YL-CI-8]
MPMLLRLRRIGLAAAALTLTWLPHASAAEVDFTGKRIEMIVPSSAGGSGDVLARFVAAHLQKELPGKPTILVKNITGGGVINGANYFQKEAKPDGLMIISSTGASILTPFFRKDEDQVRFDPSTWMQFFAGPSGYVMTGSKVGGITSLKDLKMAIDAKTPLTHGTSSVAGIALLYVLALEATGANYIPAFNVPGSDSTTGFQRGEYKINGESIASYIQITEPLVEKGEVFPLFTVGGVDENGNITRDPALPDVPSFPEAYEIMFGKAPEGPTFETFKTMVTAMVPNARGIALPPGTPPEIFAAYSEATKRAFTTPEAKEAVDKALGPFPIFYGEQAKSRLAATMQKLTPETRDYIRKLLLERFNVPI